MGFGLKSIACIGFFMSIAILRALNEKCINLTVLL